MQDDHNVGYWVALQKLWVDLRLLSGGTERHPVMELIDAVMSDEILNHKQKIKQNSSYIAISQIIYDIKSIAIPDDDFNNLNNGLLNKFNELCSPFLKKPTEEALILKDYFVIHTLKF